MPADLLITIRSLARAPLFTVTAILTMALGIGANTAIFSFVNALLLRPLPFREPDRLIRIDSVRGNETGKLTPREWEDLDRDSQLFDGVAAWYPSQYNLSEGGAPEVLTACMTTANLFRVLGVNLTHGSGWKEGTHRDRNPVVVLNHELWKRRFGGDPTIVGRTLLLDFSSYQVLGVAAPGFDFPGKMDVFRAAYLGSAQNWDVRSLFAVARLRQGVSMEQVQSRLGEFGARMEQSFPQTNQGVRFQARSLRDAYVGEVRPYVLLTLALVGLVLLVACANVVNLLLSRGFSRKRELAVKVALGAPRLRIIGELLTEAVVLACAGGVAGLAFAYWWTGLIRQWLRMDLPVWMSVELDGRVLLFTMVVSIAAGLLAGLFPAVAFSKVELHAAMRESSRGSSGSRSSARVRDVLVASELALAVALLVFAGLLVKSFWRLLEVDAGFSRTPALTFRTDPPWARYSKAEQTSQFYRRAGEALAAIPGVTAVAANHSMPLATNQNYGKPTIVVDGQSVDEQQRNPFVNVQIVSPNYHAVMGIVLREGRAFTDNDRIGTVPVAILSKPLAVRLFGGASPIGRRVRLPGLLSALNEAKAEWFQIIGVVEGVRSESLAGTPGLDIYFSNQQQFAGDTFFILRSAQHPAALSQAVARAIQKVDPEQPVFDIQALEERVEDTVWQRRMAGTLSLYFGGLALLLAAIGAYGVLSYLVSQRRREIGIRQALGSSRGQVWWLVVSEGMVLAGFGITAGLVAALLGSRPLTAVLHDVQGTDWVVLVLAVAATILMAFVASALPAWRATRVNPVDALRLE
ncbi:MAG: ABC transporter permease [Bryobacterales bacterium]|nr:ABC transporter permease [Bryobacterales bacterium]